MMRLFVRLAVAAIVMGCIGLAGIAGMFFVYGQDPALPKIEGLRDYEPKSALKIFDRKGVLIGELSSERRTVVPFKAIPKILVQAVVSAEDADFFRHRGLDYMGMLRAFVANLRAGRFAQGGSTITQQVVKTFFLTPERTIKRKMQEVLIARRLESELSKSQILHLYLNQIYFGHGRYGVQEASRFFFGKDVSQINVAEAALLAGIPQAPNRLSPYRHAARAKRRQRYVLKEMAKNSYISRSVLDKVARDPIRVVRNARPYYNVAPELATIVRSQLTKAFGKEKIATLGGEVHTTIDARLQREAREALQWGLRTIDARNKYRGALRNLKGRKRERMEQRLSKEQKTIKIGRRYLALVTAIDERQQKVRATLGAKETVEVAVNSQRYNPNGDAVTKRFAVGDLIRVRAEVGGKYRYDAGPQGAMVVMDPRTGDVLAMVGGYSYAKGGFNRATQALRQPGSAFKPFVYAAALDTGKFTPASIVDDTPVVYQGWTPKNFDGTHRGPLRLRLGLAYSINTVAAKVINEVGVEPVRQLAASLGIVSPLGNDLSLALGTSSVRVVELAQAYCAIANGGHRVEPRYIRRLGQQELQGVAPQPVLRPAVAYVLTNMMQSVVREGTARRARRLGRPAAGKTGTTNDQKDAWFAGFTPQMVAVVWVGFDRPQSIGRGETGGRAALPIWVRFMQKALRGEPKLPFAQPAGVVVHRIDPKSGLLAHANAFDALDEYFIAGTEPTERVASDGDVDPNTILMNPSPAPE